MIAELPRSGGDTPTYILDSMDTESMSNRVMVYSMQGSIRYYDSLSKVAQFAKYRSRNLGLGIHDSELGLPRATADEPVVWKWRESEGEDDRYKGSPEEETASTEKERGSTAGRGFRWIDVIGINQEEVFMLERALKLHPLTSEDIILTDTREKCETFQHYCLVCLRFLDKEAFNLGVISHRLYLIILEDQLVSISTRAVSNRFTIFRRIEQLAQGGVNLTPEWISYLLIDEVVDLFVPMIRYVEVAVESLDDLSSILKSDERTDMMLRIGEVRKKTNHLLKNLNGKSSVVKALIGRISGKSNKGTDLRLYFADVREQIISLLQDLMYFERTLSRARKNYLVQVLVEITHSSQEVNDAAMRMTTIACITFPLNVITGLFGMNVRVPGEGIPNLWWFSGILGCMFIITLIMYYYARSKNVI